jgi:preprotein translocase subunit SecD
MLYFANWKILLICAVCALGVLFSLPNLFAPAQLAWLPSQIPHKPVNLGLDLRGGSYLLLEVDVAAAQSEQLNSTIDNVRDALRDAKIGYTGLNVENGAIVFTIRDLDRIDDAKNALAKIDQTLTVDIGTDGAGKMQFSAVATEQRRQQAIDQSIEIIRRRIDPNGTAEVTIQRQGSDRILVEIPGIDNPEHIKALLGKTAKLTFQLVDQSMSPEEAKRGRMPIGDQLLQAQADRPGQPTEYLVKRRVMVGGDMLTDAQVDLQNPSGPAVRFRFDSAGGRRFGDATRENVGKPFAIVLDNKVISAPVIREPIPGGEGIITGSFTAQSASDLALLLRAGALPAPITILEERTVGPDLGADSIHAGAFASVVGVTLVAVFMILFYGLFGIFADIALFFNLCLMLGILSLLPNTALTLPGIAGIALTMGMAVDANVLIYERIREEMRSGRTMLSSLEAGFRRAFGTILDSHVTTFVAAVLLYVLGSGPVRGFAVTLGLGVLTSLFSAILVTRLQIVSWLRRWKPKEIPL